VIYFSLDPHHPVFAEHLASGGRGVYEHHGMLMLGHREHRVPLLEVGRLPFTLNGKARHNVANAMAAFAALIALGVPRERVASGLSTFTSSANQNPLRLNVYRTQGVTLLVDYAHNSAAYRAVAQTGRQLTSQRLIGVVAAPGDRRESELIDIGRVCGIDFDELIIYEMDDLRGKPPGLTAALLMRGALQGLDELTASGSRRVPPQSPQTVLDVREAIRTALAHAKPGDLVVVGCASHLSDLKDALAGQVQPAALHAAALGDVDGTDSEGTLEIEEAGEPLNA
jgi:cyanophycin synthetase